MNCIKDKEISLHEFLQKFNPEMKDLQTTQIYKKCTLAFIFDGLDESRLTLDFDSGMVTSVEERSSVDKLFTSLVNGTLLPSALVWVTSRPAAANQIPPEYVGLFTEVRGFTDQQKEEYFKKRIKDEAQASHSLGNLVVSSLCATFLSSVGSQPLFFRKSLWRTMQRAPQHSLKCTFTFC
ncbi:NLR family member X1-like [Labeo rohita]|uniref:NLR family member X1-like n=1 Tax=Labeo rohita TaxID=84645 RepID=UPI0021E209E2|nr:NLR family member X1-like [Labeo rohita]